MQGRLSPVINGIIQAFPEDNWQNELSIAQTEGFRIIEWTLDHFNLSNNPFMTKEGQQEIQDLQRKFRIDIPSLTGDCFMQKPFWKASKNERKNLENEFTDILKASNKLGVKYIVIPLVDNGSVENTSQKSYLLDYLTTWVEYLVKNQMFVIFESDLNPHLLSKFIEEFSPCFGVNYDIGNSASLGFDPTEEIKSYGARIKNIHVKDRKLNGTSISLGDGDADFKKVFESLKKINYSGNYILQTARADNGKHLEALVNYRAFVLDLLE